MSAGSANQITAARSPAPRGTLIAAYAAVWIIWGSTYFAIRVVLETLPPFLTAGLRFMLAGGILYAVGRARGAPAPGPRAWKAALLMGTLLFMGGNGAVVWAEQRIPSGPAALIIATEPILIVLMQGILPTGILLLGLLLGVGGVAVLIGPDALGGGQAMDPLATAIVILGCASWAAGSLYGRKAPLPESPLLAAGLNMISGGAVMASVGLLHGDLAAVHLSAISLRSALALAYLVVFGSIVTFTAYGYLVRHQPPSRVATYAYVNPIVAVALGALLGGEVLSPRIAGAAALIVSGVVLIGWSTRPRPAQA